MLVPATAYVFGRLRSRRRWSRTPLSRPDTRSAPCSWSDPFSASAATTRSPPFGRVPRRAGPRCRDRAAARVRRGGRRPPRPRRRPSHRPAPPRRWPAPAAPGARGHRGDRCVARRGRSCPSPCRSDAPGDRLRAIGWLTGHAAGVTTRTRVARRSRSTQSARVIAGASAAGRAALLEPEGLQVLEAAGIAVPALAWRSPPRAASTTRLLAGLPGRPGRREGRLGPRSSTRPTSAASRSSPTRRRRRSRAAIGGDAGAPGRRGRGLHRRRVRRPRRRPRRRAPALAALDGRLRARSSASARAASLTEALSADLRPGREIAIVSPALHPARMASARALAAHDGGPARDDVPARAAAAPARSTGVTGGRRRGCSPSRALVPGRAPRDRDQPGGGHGRRPRRPRRPRHAGRRPAPGAGAPAAAQGRPAARAAVDRHRRRVSSGTNPGRVILRNVLREGFDPERVTVVKPGTDAIDGVRCVPDLASLPEKVDLLVVVLPAAHTPAFVAEVVERDLRGVADRDPGRPGGEGAAAARSRRGCARPSPTSRDARATAGRSSTAATASGSARGPGATTPCSSRAASCRRASVPAPVALVTGSGAFAITRLSRLAPLDPRYVVTIGNQMDLTAGDFLAHLADDPAVRVFGVYVEGFTRLDGLRFMEAAARITAGGPAASILYRAGRTAAGASASASHTAAIAGDVTVDPRAGPGRGRHDRRHAGRLRRPGADVRAARRAARARAPPGRHEQRGLGVRDHRRPRGDAGAGAVRAGHRGSACAAILAPAGHRRRWWTSTTR